MSPERSIEMWIGITLLVISFFFLHRPLRMAIFRFNLFRLRDRLFDMARDGKISFTDPAYTLLWDSINERIRYAKLLGFCELILVGFAKQFIKNVELRERGEKWRAEFTTAIGTLPGDVRESLQGIKAEMQEATLEYLLLGSTVFLLMVFPLGIVILCIEIFGSTRKVIKWLNTKCKPTWQLIEDTVSGRNSNHNLPRLNSRAHA